MYPVRPIARRAAIILSWLALFLLLAASGVFVCTAGRGWASVHGNARRIDRRMQGDATELRIKASFCVYRSRHVTFGEVFDLGQTHNNWPAPGIVQQESRSGFGLPDYDPSSMPAVAAPPDRVSGWDIMGTGYEARYRELPVNGQFGIGSHTQSWYCCTAWPMLLLAALAFPAVRSIARTLLLIHRAFRNQRAHQQGLCPTCRYDIRATPQRCPECGRIQYEPSAKPLWFARRLTWRRGGLLILPAVLAVVADASWQAWHGRDDSWFHYALGNLIVIMAEVGGLALTVWAIRHTVIDIRRVVRTYGE